MKNLPKVTQFGRMTENGQLYPAWLLQSLLLSFPEIFIGEMEIGLEFEQMSTLNWVNVGEREQLKGRGPKDILSRKNSFRENVKMEEYRKHVGGWVIGESSRVWVVRDGEM